MGNDALLNPLSIKDRMSSIKIVSSTMVLSNKLKK
jgi:hypothetical protein